jgi:hypothetical protein
MNNPLSKKSIKAIDSKYKAGKPYTVDMITTNANRISVWVAFVNLAC